MRTFQKVIIAQKITVNWKKIQGSSFSEPLSKIETIVFVQNLIHTLHKIMMSLLYSGFVLACCINAAPVVYSTIMDLNLILYVTQAIIGC